MGVLLYFVFFKYFSGKGRLKENFNSYSFILFLGKKEISIFIAILVIF